MCAQRCGVCAVTVRVCRSVIRALRAVCAACVASVVSYLRLFLAYIALITFPNALKMASLTSLERKTAGFDSIFASTGGRLTVAYGIGKPRAAGPPPRGAACAGCFHKLFRASRLQSTDGANMTEQWGCNLAAIVPFHDSWPI